MTHNTDDNNLDFFTRENTPSKVSYVPIYSPTTGELLAWVEIDHSNDNVLLIKVSDLEKANNS